LPVSSDLFWGLQSGKYLRGRYFFEGSKPDSPEDEAETRYLLKASKFGNAGTRSSGTNRKGRLRRPSGGEFSFYPLFSEYQSERGLLPNSGRYFGLEVVLYQQLLLSSGPEGLDTISTERAGIGYSDHDSRWRPTRAIATENAESKGKAPVVPGDSSLWTMLGLR
jgi:hypothetical protein